MDKPTLVECVEVGRKILVEGRHGVYEFCLTDSEQAALARLIEVCERINCDTPTQVAFTGLAGGEFRNGVIVGWQEALAWARGER